MNLVPYSWAVATAFVCADNVLAQDGDAAARAIGFRLDRVYGVVTDEAGAAWAIGRDYKARIADGRIDFVPALGSNAPSNRTLSFELMSVHRGATPLDAANGAATATVDDTTVSFARGSITERYECRPEGVQQSFVFAQRPPGDGDLVVRGALTTSLPASPRADGSWFFGDGDVGGVSIGGVTGIDAAGARCAGSVQFAAGVLELRLPQAFVEHAAYPLVLDPLLGTGFPISGSPDDDDQVQVAYEESLNVYLVVFRRTYSFTDQDILAQRVTTSGAFFGPVVSITLTPTVETRPAVAAVNSRNRFVVAWQWTQSGFGPSGVRAVTVSTATVGTAVDVSAPGESSLRPAVCGDRSASGTKALIAWLGGGMQKRRTADVTATGSITLGTTHATASVFGSLSDIRLPQSRTPTGITVMAAVSNTLTTTERRALALDYDGVALGGAVLFSLTAAGVGDDFGFDGDGANFLATYRSSSLAQGLCTALQWNGTTLAVGATTTFSPTAPTRTAVAWLGERFLVAWEAPTANPFDSDLKAIAIKPDCTTCSVEFAVPMVTRPNQRAPAIGSCFHAGSGLPEALLAWSEAAATPPFASSVVAQRFAAMTGSAPLLLSASCPGGGTAGSDEPFALGSENFAFTLAGGDPSAPLAILGLGDGSTAPIPCGCTFINSLVTYALVAQNGGARFAFPLPCNPQLLGVTLEYQWLLLGASTSPCPLAPGLTGSDRLLLTLGL